MNAKRIVFIIMCVLLATTVTLVGIVVWRSADMIGSLRGGGTVEDPTGTSAPTDPPTDPPTNPPTEPPTEAPTDPPHEHYFLPNKIQYPTCETEGWTIYKCSCGGTKVGDFKGSLGHNWVVDTAVEVTCESDGWTINKCSRCAKTQEQNRVNKLGHDMSVIKQFPATCTEDAKVVTSCSHAGCTHKIEEITPGSALDHNWGPEERVEPTCTEDGHVLKKCTNDGCEEEEKEILPAIGHSFDVWQDTAGGHKESVCSNADCGATVSSVDLKIMKQYSAETTHHIIEVGTEAVPVVFTYHVVDNRAEQLRNDHQPVMDYDAATGFSVTYEKAAGGEKTLTLTDPLKGGTLQIEDVPESTESQPEDADQETPETPQG